MIMSADFDSIPLDNDESPDDIVLTESISSNRRLPNPQRKHSLDDFDDIDDIDLQDSLFPRKYNGSIAPSVEEEKDISRQQRENGKLKPKVTVREAFDDDEVEAILDYRQGSSKSIAPVVENTDDMEITQIRKEKPSRKEKKSKGKRGETLTAEHAIEFMIKERQAMDEEYAVLRKENEELRNKMDAQQHITPTKTDKGPPPPVVVERVVEKHVADPHSSKWKEDAERLRAENESLRQKYAERERTIEVQRDLANEARTRRLSQLSPSGGQEKRRARESGSRETQVESTKQNKKNTQRREKAPSPVYVEEKSDSSESGSETSSSEEDSSAPQGHKPRKDKGFGQFSSFRSDKPNKKPKRSQRPNVTLDAEPSQLQTGSRSMPGGPKGVPRLDLSTVSSPTQSLAPQHPQHTAHPSHHVPAPPPAQQTVSAPADSKYSGLPVLLWKGAILWKIPYNGRGLPERRLVMIKRATRPGPRAKPVQVVNAGTSQSGLSAPVAYIIYPPTLIWANPDKPDDLSNARELSLYEGAHLVEGHQSPAFWKSKNRGNPLPPEKLCFSVVTSTRSLDLAAESVNEALSWKAAIHTLLVIMSSNKDWAIDKLKRQTPTWHHEQLEKPPKDYSRERAEPEPPQPSARATERVDPRGDAAYREAAATARTAPNMSLKDQMFRATREGNYELLRNILRTKISVNLMESENSDTPLMIACRAGYDDIVKLCLHFGARNDPHPDFGQTALHCAVEGRSHKCARVLLEAAAPSQANVVIVNLKDANEKTPLHIAAAFGDTKMCRLLLSHGAALHNRDNNLKTPLHLCAANGHKICLSFLLDHEGDSYLDLPDVYGNTALHLAAEQGQYACAKLLLETAANPIARTNKGQTPYNLANARGHQPICQLLLEYNDPESMQRPHSLSVDTGSMGMSRIERNVSYPVGGFDSMGLPRPHTASRSISAGGFVPQQAFYIETNPRQLMYDPSTIVQPMTARGVSTGSMPFSSGSLTSRDRPSSLFQGLQLNNPLTSRPNVGGGDSRQRASSYDVNTISQSAGQSYSPIVVESFFGSSSGKSSAAVSGGGSSYQHQYQNQQEQVTSSAERDITKPLEEFELGGTDWAVYETEEGYYYYLDSVTQHSQWEDPRTHGLLTYDEATGEYTSQEIPTISDTYRDSSGGRNGNGGESTKRSHRSSDNDADADIPTMESEYRQSSKKGDLRSKSHKPRKIVADDVSPDGKEGGRLWSGSDDDSIDEMDSTDRNHGQSRRGGNRQGGKSRRRRAKEYFGDEDDDDFDMDAEDLAGEVPVRRGGDSAKGGRVRRRGAVDQDVDLEIDIGEDFELDPDDVNDVNMEGMQQRHGGKGKTKSYTGGGGYYTGGGDVDYVADDLDAMQFGDDIRRQKARSKGQRATQGGAFADADDPQFLLDGPDEGSSPVDGDDDRLKTNCFSPDKASLQRAAQLQRSFSPKALLASPNGSASGSEVSTPRRKNVKSKTEKKEKAAAFSDEEEMDYSRPRRKHTKKGKGHRDNLPASSHYSDEDEDEGEGDEGSDWDQESEVEERPPSTKTGHLGNIENTIKTQSTSKKGKKKALKSQKTPPKDLDEDKLKLGKIFTADMGGYGNGGNTYDIAPIESEPKPAPLDALPTLKAGGRLSPRPQMDDVEMEQKIEPYIQMLKDGVPYLTVKNKMARAGESREIIKLMLERADELSITTNVDMMRTSSDGGSSAQEAKSNKLSKEELDALKQDPEIGKYIKMNGMGVPVLNIIQKMELDQLNPETVDRVKGYLGVKTAEEEDSNRGSLRDSLKRKSSVPLLKMHWNTLPPEKLKNSIFAGGQDEDSMQDEELEELEKLFGAQSKPTVETEKVVDKRMKLLVLDGKRAQNVIIGLAQFKSFGPHDSLLGAVCALNGMNGQLNGDRLQNLSQLIPSIPESRKIHGMQGSEHPAEVFFMVADKFYPDLPKRLACFITCCTFEESYVSLMSKMRKIIDACNEVISSDNLARVLQKMLTVGNLMNEGTYRGQASGFSLDSLLKMVHTKGVDKKTSVLDYVVKSLLDKTDDAVVGVSEDLSFDDETARMSGKDTGREVDHLQQGISQLEQALSEAREDPPDSAAGEFTDAFVAKLGEFLSVHLEKMKEMNKTRKLMDRKIVIVVEYFGEDENVCDTTNIFSVLREFKMAFEHSRKAIINKMERMNRVNSRTGSMGDENKSPRF